MKTEDLHQQLHALALQVPEYFEHRVSTHSATKFPDPKPKTYTEVKVWHGVLGTNTYEEFIMQGSEAYGLARIRESILRLNTEHLASLYTNVPNL